jgi:phosphocarrier protein FPr
MIALVIVAHSRALANDVVALARQMASPEVRFAIAAGVGEGRRELGTDATEIAEAIESVFNPDGVLVLMDLGSAVLSAETALDLLPAQMRERVRLCPAPLVEGALAAAVQAGLGADLDQACREAVGALQPKCEHLAAGSHLLSTGDTAPLRDADDGRQAAGQTVVTLDNPHGLHARPAARFVQAAARFDATVTVRKLAADGDATGAVASARSVNQLAMLGAQRGDRLLIMAEGPQARDALEALRALAASHFGERDEAEAGERIPEAGAGGAPAPQAGPAAAWLVALPVSEGIAIGVAARAQARLPVIREGERAGEPDAEQRRLDDALMQARRDIDARRQSIRAGMGEQRAAIFDAHRLILDDEMLAGRAARLIREERMPAAQAWHRAVEELAGAYRALPDAYMRQRAADVIDVGAQVLAHLGEMNDADLPTQIGQPAILIAHDFTPTQVAQLDLDHVAGLVSVGGSRDSHAAILMRALGLPAVSGADAAIERVSDGVTVAVDGFDGRIWINPGPEALAELERRRDAWREQQRRLREAGQALAITRDGARIEVAANLGSVADARAALANGAEAVGVLRTEFLYLTRREPPGEDEQVEALAQIGRIMQGRPIIARTLDVGGDKAIPYLPMSPEANPFLGVRAIRLSLRRRELFLTQLRAILRAGAEHDVRVLLPMISLVEEIEQARACLEEAHRALLVEGLPHRWPASLGAMIETPSAALMADALAARVDFLSIGTNDLTQYTLAAERGNPSLAAFADALHPAVLRLIKIVADAATRHGKWAGVCGEIAADPVAAPVLIGLGVSELSLNPAGIPKVKSIVRALGRREAARLADQALQMETAPAVRQLAARFVEGREGS